MRGNRVNGCKDNDNTIITSSCSKKLGAGLGQKAASPGLWPGLAMKEGIIQGDYSTTWKSTVIAFMSTVMLSLHMVGMTQEPLPFTRAPV